MSVEKVLSRLANLRKTTNGWTACCPAHDDRENSLSLGEGNNGRTLLKCFAGCEAEAIVKALGLTMEDLFSEDGKSKGRRGEREDNRGHGTATVQPQTGITLAKYAEAKKLHIDFLRGIGLSDMSYMGTPAVRIPYSNENGNEVSVRFRVALAKTENGDNRFRWKRGSKSLLYGLERLDHARTAGYICCVEGESDCHTLWYHDIPAVGLPGATTWREDRDAAQLESISLIYVLIEPDRGGETVMHWLSSSRIRERVRLIYLDKYKDPSDLHVADPDHFKTRWNMAVEAAIPWRDHAAAAEKAERRTAWEQCKALAREPHILDKFADAIRARGVAGESRSAKLIYLAVISRLLDRPVSLAVKGPSAGGKSYVVERTLEYFPSTAYYTLTAMSERALAYSNEPLAHRVLVLYEAGGLGNFASYLIRSLLSEGRVRYETVEKTKDGLRPRLIEREGPTGLIVTTTALHLHPENETRLLSIPVTDTAEQTRSVLVAIAQERNQAPDLIPWHSLQVWLELSEHRVTIPYAEKLAKQIPALAVRLRRDFGVILNLIRAHAILHQANRPREETGRIIATITDYAAIRDLVADLVAEGIQAAVPETIRATVKAVSEVMMDSRVNEVSVTQVGRNLHLDKSAAWRRVRAAIERGFLTNLEERKGRPARLVLGEPLSDECEVLPKPELLEDGCKVAGENEEHDDSPLHFEEIDLRC